MPPTLASIERQARELSVEERAELAVILLETIEPSDDPEEVAEAWSAEIRARLAAYERGEVKLIDGESVFAKARKLTK